MNLDFLSDTVEIFGKETSIGTIILSILALLAVALLLRVNVIHFSKKKRKEGTPDDDGGLKPLDIESPSTPTSPPPKPQNIEEMYAENNGLLVCPFCETLNAKGNTRCCACGNSLSKRGFY